MILMNDFRRQWQDTREDVLRAVEGVGESGWYITGAALATFEHALAAAWTLPYCAGVASGLDAIEISLRALGCQPGDRVLTTPLSAFATTLAIVKIGAIPVFADTDRFGLIDLDECGQALSRRADIHFMVPVHLYGHALDLERLKRLKERFGLGMVEDCAQSISATHQGALTGTVGDLAATSFYPTKNLGALGDGGAILTRDEQLWTRVRALRNYGQSAKYRHDYIGYNSRLDEVHAAILERAYLHRLPAWTARRRDIAGRYLAGIAHGGIRVMGAPPGSQPCFHLFPVTVAPESKRRFMAHLERKGVSSAEHYPVLIPDQRAMAGVAYEGGSDWPNARCLAQGEVSLPIHPYLTGEEVDLVIAACNGWEG
jgi:dTDP-3-amino-3,4,6-trideoxy-alpha-D-glucose transaminase